MSTQTVCDQTHNLLDLYVEYTRCIEDPTTTFHPLQYIAVDGGCSRIFNTSSMLNKVQRKLMNVGQSPELLNALSDSRLQDIIRKIDGASNRLTALEEVMARDEDFTAFVTKMLRTIQEPL